MGALGLVVRDHALRDGDGVAQLDLGHPFGLPQRGEPGAESFQGPLFHEACAPPRAVTRYEFHEATPYEGYELY